MHYTESLHTLKFSIFRKENDGEVKKSDFLFHGFTGHGIYATTHPSTIFLYFCMLFFSWVIKPAEFKLILKLLIIMKYRDTLLQTHISFSPQIL